MWPVACHVFFLMKYLTFDLRCPVDHQKTGIQVIGNHCERELILAICRFVRFLKQKYEFPILLKIILCDSAKVTAPISKEQVVSVIWTPDSHTKVYKYPYILIAAGNYLKDRRRLGRDDALASYLDDLACRILSYQNWLKRDSLNVYAICIKARNLLYEYAETREHP